jgi:DNA-binding GntR family transcriptional regulator
MGSVPITRADEGALTPGAESPRREMVSRAYDRLRGLIVRGELSAGTRLIEADVAQRLGMSRTPVRTALYMLHQEGYLEPTGEGRKSSLIVPPLTREDATEIFGIVGEVEGLAARWAASLPAERRVALVHDLEALNAAMVRVATQSPPDPTETIRCDTEFHRRYVEAGAKRRLRTFHRAIKPHADRYIHLYYTTLTTEILVSTQEHDVIIRAIAAGDPATAQRAVQSNWENAVERLGKSIERFGERGVW